MGRSSDGSRSPQYAFDQCFRGPAYNTLLCKAISFASGLFPKPHTHDDFPVLEPCFGLRAPGECLLLHCECRFGFGCIGSDSRMRRKTLYAHTQYLADRRAASMYRREPTSYWMRPHGCRVPVRFDEFDPDTATMFGATVYIRRDVRYASRRKSHIEAADIVTEILRIQATLCHRPHDSRASWVRVTAYVTGIIPIIVITARFASRHLGGNNYWWDDWIHLASAVSSQLLVQSNSAYNCHRF